MTDPQRSIAPVPNPDARARPPTLGRNVHYLCRAGGLRPAVVTATAPEGHEDQCEVWLEVFGLDDADDERHVRATEGTEPGSWRWPPIFR